MLIHFYDIKPSKPGVYFSKSKYGIVQSVELKWYKDGREYLGIRQHDGISIYDPNFVDDKWSEIIEFSFDD